MKAILSNCQPLIIKALESDYLSYLMLSWACCYCLSEIVENYSSMPVLKNPPVGVKILANSAAGLEIYFRQVNMCYLKGPIIYSFSVVNLFADT